MRGDLTPTPGTNREPIRASGGDSLRRKATGIWKTTHQRGLGFPVLANDARL
jgi:hypothetical protein